MHLQIERERIPTSVGSGARRRSFRVVRALLRKRKTRRALLVTLGILILVRVAAFLPLPGVDVFGAVPR
jgi:preprotein translocase subunit SecY